MGLRLSFDFYGDTQLDRTLARIQEQVTDARPAFDAIADKFADLERRQFDSEGGAASGGWTPLSGKYAAWKAKHYPGAPILVRTGALRDSLTSRPFGVEEIDAQRMAIGSDVEYGKYHQNGDGVPRRRPVELTESSRRDLTKILQRYVLTGETP